MDELKLILEMGGNFKDVLETAGPWFLVYLFAKPVLVFTGAMITLFVFYRIVCKAIDEP